MRRIRKYLLLILILCAVVALIIPHIVWANSAEPPSLIILINNPPKDLSVVMVSNENQPEARVRRAAWEGYYVFYLRDMQAGDDYIFKVTADGKSFECRIDEPLKRYNNVFTLDMSNRKLTPGTYPFRTVILVTIRVFLTLLIEGIIFWLFRYRQMRSWLIFFAINLVTQGALNIGLNYGGAPLKSYLILNLILGECLVFAAEMIAFTILINEHEKYRTLGYVFIANLVSLIAGGYIISHLPV